MGQPQLQTQTSGFGYNNKSGLSFGAPSNQGGSLLGNSAPSNNTISYSKSIIDGEGFISIEFSSSISAF